MRLHYKNPSGLTLPRLNLGSPWVTFFVVYTGLYSHFKARVWKTVYIRESYECRISNVLVL